MISRGFSSAAGTRWALNRVSTDERERTRRQVLAVSHGEGGTLRGQRGALVSPANNGRVSRSPQKSAGITHSVLQGPGESRAVRSSLLPFSGPAPLSPSQGQRAAEGR